MARRWLLLLRLIGLLQLLGTVILTTSHEKARIEASRVSASLSNTGEQTMCTCGNPSFEIPRRDFIATMGVSVAGASLSAGKLLGAGGLVRSPGADKKPVTIRGAFLYPPTKVLDQEGYYSWPGSDFDAEGRHKAYLPQVAEMEGRLGIRIVMDQEPLDAASDVDQFIAGIKATKPDGLLLFPFKKYPPWHHMIRIIEETQIPTVILATLGVFQNRHVRHLDQPGVYIINSPDNLEAVENGLRMIKTGCFLREATILNLAGNSVEERTVPFLGTTVRNIPLQRFYDHFAQTGATEEVRALAEEFATHAAKIVQPTREDIVDAARTYFVLKTILEEEKGDALMMTCLAGLRQPRKHVPPCMGFMRFLDQGTAMGCESDLDGTLTMMLMQALFGKPGFLHNSGLDTERNHYWGAHCTAPSRMNGPGEPASPYELMSHAEAGFGTVPRVLFAEGQEVTLARDLSWPPEPISRPTIEALAARAATVPPQEPRLLLYSGKIVRCPPIPPAGGCRTNVEIAINELDRAIDLIGNHMVMMYGNHVQQFRQFCQLHGIEVVV